MRRDLTTDAVTNTATVPSDALNPTDPGSAIESPSAERRDRPRDQGDGQEGICGDERGWPQGPGGVDERSQLIDHEAFDTACRRTIQRSRAEAGGVAILHVRLY